MLNMPAAAPGAVASGQAADVRKSPINSFSALSMLADEYADSEGSSPQSTASPAPGSEMRADMARPSLAGVSVVGSSSAGFPADKTCFDAVSMSMDSQAEGSRSSLGSMEQVLDENTGAVISVRKQKNNATETADGVSAVPIIGTTTDSSAMKGDESMDVDVPASKDVQDASLDMSMSVDDSQSQSFTTPLKRKGPSAIPFTEYANLSLPAPCEGDLSMSNMTFIDESSNQSNSNMAESSKKPKRSRLEIQDEDS